MLTQNPRSIRPFSLPAGLMIAVLALAGSAQGQNLGKPGPDGITVVSPQAKAQAASPVGPAKAAAPGEVSHGPQEGIKVHGHWIIDVKNPDGTLAQHRDFENSLVGANDMIGFLYGSEVASDFAIYLYGSTPPCVVSSGFYCDIVHNLTVLPASARCGGSYDYCVTGLTVTPTFGGSPALVLAGNLTATQAGSISVVGTFIGICGSPTTALTTTSASSCAAGNNAYGYGGLTQTSITAVPVISGQIVQVTVTITFS